MAESRTKNAARNIIFATLNKILALLLPFVTRTIILYLLGSTFLGLSSLFTSILSFLSLAELGLGVAIVHSMYKPIAESDTDLICALLAYYKKLYHCIGIVILLAGTVMLPFLPHLIRGNAPDGVNIYILFYIYLLNSVLSYFLAGYKQCLLSAHQRSDITSKISIVATFVMQIGQIAILCITQNYYVYALLPIFSTLTINILNAVITDKMYPQYKCRGKLSKSQRNKIQKKISGLIGTKLNSVVVHSTDSLVVAAFLGLVDTAMYDNYYYLVNAISGFIMLFFSSITAGTGNSIVTETIDKNYKLFRKLSLLNSWGVGWCCVCLICLYHPFMVIWVGEELAYPFSVEFCFVLYFYIYNIQRVILMFKDAAGIWYEDRFRPYVAMIINVFLNFTLVQVIGVYGIILSSVFAFAISVPWANYILFKTLFKKKAIENLLRMLKDGGIIVVASVATYYICGLFGSGIIAFIEKIVICCIVPNLLFWFFYHNEEEYKDVLDMIKNRLPAPFKRYGGWNMDIKQVCINILNQFRRKESTVDSLSRTYLKRFKLHAFTEGKCTEYGQFEASITKLYHSIEKGLAYNQYKAGFGRKNIDKLILSMEQYSKKYDLATFFYETALSVLQKYIEKNKQYGLVDENLENRVRNLPGHANTKGGIIELKKPDSSVQNIGFKEFVLSRHSIRHFSNEPASIDYIQKAVDLAQHTPSACNRQGWSCKLVCDKQMIQKVLENQNGNRGFGEKIDKLIIVVSDLNYFSYGRELYQAFIDGGMYSMNVIHALHYYGIATIPLSASLSSEQDENVRKLLKIKENEILIMFIGCGNYPEETIKTTRSERRSFKMEVIS